MLLRGIETRGCKGAIVVVRRGDGGRVSNNEVWRGVCERERRGGGLDGEGTGGVAARAAVEL